MVEMATSENPHERVRQFFCFASGLTPLPTDAKALSDFVSWAQRGHILGQVAAVASASDNKRLQTLLENAATRSAYDKRMLKFETERIERALLGTDIRVVLLKGSAYVAEDLLAGIGRRVSDIDILVKEEDLPEAEKLLRQAGWKDEVSTANPYDQKYYRDWMHELPPLRHSKRRTIIDVHHRLLPRTARISPDHLAMMADASPVGDGNLLVFAPVDRFIHSAIHIFADGALETPARSLLELFYLFNDLSVQERDSLESRAAFLNVMSPVQIALWALKRYFGVMVIVNKSNISKVLRLSIETMVENGRAAPLARVLLYVRSHYLRMPLPLLMAHLFRKAIRRG
ncbi:MAG: nucleotidyltransferase family protein [Alphaproteobacteria bacterium]|nr:nucleotidyltransferase family protein [Alphaproteobacteria bacterium]